MSESFVLFTVTFHVQMIELYIVLWIAKNIEVRNEKSYIRNGYLHFPIFSNFLVFFLSIALRNESMEMKIMEMSTNVVPNDQKAIDLDSSSWFCPWIVAAPTLIAFLLFSTPAAISDRIFQTGARTYIKHEEWRDHDQ